MGVRWDEVVKQNSFWSTGQNRAVPDVLSAARDPAQVEVWLFGMLAGPEATSPLVMQFRRGLTLGDAIGELGRRFGPDILRHIVAESGEIFSTCRVFVDGVLARSVNTPITGARSTAKVEIILLREIEGG